MSENFMLFQLAFNVVMFVALAVVVWRSFRTTTAAPPKPKPAAEPKPATSWGRRAASSPAPAALPPALEDLVDLAERKELAAEAALRARLTKYRDVVGN